jgi:hypothetical protein
MTLQEEAVSRYHKLLDSPAYKDLAWVQELQEQMAASHLISAGKPVCPVLRPHLVPRRQYDALVKAESAIQSAVHSIHRLANANPAIMARLDLLPAEKMLAGIDPHYSPLTVASRARVSGSAAGTFLDFYTGNPQGVAYGDALAGIFMDAKPVKEWRKKYKLTRWNGVKKLLNAVLGAYKESGKKKFPRIAFVEFRAPFSTGPASEYLLLAEQFRQAGYPTEVVTPDQLEYRNGVLSRGDFGIEIVYRLISAQEFLMRFDLSHPLLRAYRDGAIVMVNSFKTELLQKRALFSLLTDENITAKFPAAERNAILEHIPWTRMVKEGRTKHKRKTIDLTEYVLSHREKLVLKPNDVGTDLHSFRGWEMDDAAWERALKSAMRNPYVVQERVAAPTEPFPVYQFGQSSIKEMSVALSPHSFLGKVESCTATVTESGSAYSMLSGQAPTFILEGQGR